MRHCTRKPLLFFTALVAASSISLGALAASGAFASSRTSAARADDLPSCLKDLSQAKKALALVNSYLSKKGENAVIVWRLKTRNDIVTVRQWTDFLLVQYVAGEITAREYAAGLHAVASSVAATRKFLLLLKRQTESSIAATAKRCEDLRSKQPPPPPPPGSFHLVSGLTQVTNPNAPELKIDAAGQKALWDHCCVGGAWKVDFKFDVPEALTPGKASALTLGIDVHDVKPEQPLLIAMTALAPDFKEQLSVHYPSPGKASKTYQLAISPSLKDAEEIVVTIGVVSAEVKYHYRR